MDMTSLVSTADAACGGNALQAPGCKRRIASAFGRAASTYDNAARLQKQVAEQTRSCLPALTAADAAILDLGCGTGLETRALGQRYRQARLFGLDLSPDMLSLAQSHQQATDCHWICGDLEVAPLPSGYFDLVYSSLAVQWCADLADVLSSCYRLLSPGGWFVFSTLAAGTLHELSTAWRLVDGRNHTNCYPPLSLHRQKLMRSRFAVHRLYQQTHRLYYPSALHLIRELKALGANTLVDDQPASGLTGKQAMVSLEKAYRTFAGTQGVPATWQVVYTALRKPP
ncbi:MAG: malonyl-ACP O-methyltransferase BioC [Kistimonas sp.]|nr:malonyl-ACP O-methyltransferase BioC [Kistimonas sp.]